MSCTVKIFYDALRIPGTPSEGGQDYYDGFREITVPSSAFIGEWIADGGGFSYCPGVTQYITRARNPQTGEIIGEQRSTTCHRIVFKRWENTCADLYDCVNGVCVTKDTYNTPGIYSSLEECQANCASGSGCNPPNICASPDYCPPGMVCIPSEEWNQIEPLSSAVKGKACG